MKIPRKTLTVAAVVLCIALIIVGLELSNKTHFFHEASTRNGINYGPPTEVEKQDSVSHKDSIPTANSQNSNTQTSNASSKKTVTTEITTFRQTSSAFTVNGFVNGVIENGGTCTLTMVFSGDASQKVTESRPGEANATNTTCGEISVPLSKLHAGTWNTTLSYSSATATGTSDVNPLEVQ
jgi:hypothetical protein